MSHHSFQCLGNSKAPFLSLSNKGSQTPWPIYRATVFPAVELNLDLATPVCSKVTCHFLFFCHHNPGQKSLNSTFFPT